MSRKLYVILNGKVAGATPLRVALAKARSRGVTVETRVTRQPGDALAFARQGLERLFPALKSGENWVFVAGGGDGTINQVASGLWQGLTELSGKEFSSGSASQKPFNPSSSLAAMPVAPRLGILPLGTANDLAAGLGLPLNKPEKALEFILEGQEQAFDLGEAVDLEHGRSHVFVNMATGGFGAEVSAHTGRGLKERLGKGAYLLTGLSRAVDLHAQKVSVKLPNGGSWQGQLLALAIGNGRQSGGGLPLCPFAKVNDGLLDIMWLRDLKLDDQVSAVLALGAGGIKELVHFADSSRVTWLEIESEKPLQVNLDGEPIRARRLRFAVLPAVFRLVGARKMLI
ncbi:YegS/Rv2252/BmrU family lipid kinase [Rhodovibrionaceae bacterium A322]